MPIVPPVPRAGTRDLPDVPPFVHYVLGCFLPPILAWVSALVYRQILSQCADHPLVQLAHYYDPAPVIAACAAYQHHHGPGAPPTFPIAVLVRAEIVRAWADSCGDPDLAWLLASNLIARWYVGLPLLGPTPDHSTLNRFHAWLTLHAPDALFRDVLVFLGRVDPEDAAATPQIVDTFAMASPAAPTPGPTQLLGHLTMRLIRTWQTQAPPTAPAVLLALDGDALRHPPRARTALERQQQLQTAVQAATHVADALTPHLGQLSAPARTLAQDLIAAIGKVIADETSTAADGTVQERPADDRGTYRLMSAIDRESTFRKHEGSPAVFGSNAVVSATPTRIRAALILTGSTPDSEAPAAVIRQLQAQGQPLPPYLVMDQAGGWGATRARVAALSAGLTQMVAQIPQGGGADLTRYTPADFQVSADRTTCTCPHGVSSTKATPKPGVEGMTFRFTAAQCRDCPLRDHCRDPLASPRSYRTVFISDHHAMLRAAARFNATDTGKALLHGRWRVEPTIAWLVRYHGCRQARRVGLVAAQCQLFQACAVRNLLLWISRLQRGLARRPAALTA
jgi:Transposase DDE domain/Transposase domain (DUF772)